MKSSETSIWTKIKNVLIVLIIMAVCAIFLVGILHNARGISSSASRNNEAMRLEPKRIHVSKMDIIPMGYICQPFTDAAVLVYTDAMVPLTRPNGFVVTCAEAVQLGVLE